MKKISRRSFIRAAGLATVAGAINPFDLAAKERKPSKKKQTIPEMEPIEADVIVIGAGPSGIPAAIAAAREGARVVLLEEDMVPGGAPVDMYVAMLCGTPRVGIFRELIQLLNQKYTTTGTARPDFGIDGANKRNHWYLPSSYVLANTELMAREKHLTLMCGARVSELIITEKGNRNLVQGAVIYRNGFRQEIKAPITIDATGTGLIGELAGAPVMYGRDGRSTFGESIGKEYAESRVQSCTWQFITQALTPNALLPWQELRWRGMVEDNHRWVRADDVARGTGLYLHWGGRFECKDTRDPVELAATQAEALESLRADFAAYRKAGFQVHLAPKIGVREVRRIKGEYVLTTEHLKQGLFPEDTITYCNYGIDAWGEHIKKEDARVKSYGIPYRSLLPLNVEGLIIAGRSISGSHLAMSSYRVQPIVAGIGQAAGTAAAMAALHKTSARDIEVHDLVAKLKTAGMFDVKKLKK
ncbi:MAG: FAD-dependent oxidoreductase [Alistipes sp.]|nr:FAD-dependent oxidoreductase [Alistipes sp.]